MDNKNNDMKLRHVLKENKAEHLYEKIMKLSDGAKDNCLVIFGWKHVEAFLQAAKEHYYDCECPDLPDSLIIPLDMCVNDFKMALLNYARVPGAEPSIESTVLPCTITQCCHCIAILQFLNYHPWTQHVIAHNDVALPIATVLVLRPGGTDTVDYAFPTVRNSLWR